MTCETLIQETSSNLGLLHKEANSSITHRLEFFNLLEIRPWLHPHLGLKCFDLPAVTGQKRYIIHGPSHHLLLHIRYLLEFQKSVLRHHQKINRISQTPDTLHLELIMIIKHKKTEEKVLIPLSCSVQ